MASSANIIAAETRPQVNMILHSQTLAPRRCSIRLLGTSKQA